MDEWYQVVERHSGGGLSRLVVIDDGSRDDTYKIMKEYAAGHPLFRPVTKSNGGHGATVLYGYQYALKNGADYIFQTDSDGQTVPEEFEQFWRGERKIRSCDRMEESPSGRDFEDFCYRNAQGGDTAVL